jgi:hypothetical protein
MALILLNPMPTSARISSKVSQSHSWTRNPTEEISLFHNKINGQVIFAGGVNVARDFTRQTLNCFRQCYCCLRPGIFLENAG